MATITIEHLTKTYRRRVSVGGWRGLLHSLVHRQEEHHVAVEDLSLTIAAGELVGLIGPNGAGKSTLIKMLCGILVPDRGTCTVGGLVPWRERRRHCDRLGVVFGQRSQLWWDLPVADSFALLAAIYDRPAATWRARTQAVVETLGIGPVLRRPVRQLSLGERMRCELAAALLPSPSVLILDEPTIGLDAQATLAVRECLSTIHRSGVTILLATHDLDDIEALCPRVLVLHQGRLLLDGSLEQLRALGGQERLVRIDARVALTPPPGDGIVVLGQEGGRLRLRIDTAVRSLAPVLAGLFAQGEIIDCVVEPPAIERVVARLFAQGAP